MNFRFVDLFCGGGGSITGAIEALKQADIKYDGRGFNHWETAISTIHANHPEIVPDYQIDELGRVHSRACAPIESVLPDEIFDTDPQRIDCVWASPSCTHHSNAAGGKPRSNQLRSQPEYLLPYLRLTKCRRMFIENVKELQNWGPILDKDTTFKGKNFKAGQADPRKAGTFFNLWYREIKASGYSVDMQIMNAADYGAATSRERLIIQAVRKSTGEKIIWPEPTHTKEPGLLAGSYKPWRSAAEIIDWSIPGKSIFNRDKPLCKNTLRRIENGIKKYWGTWAEPFLIVLRGTSENAINSTAIPLDSPVPTITAEGGHIALIKPIIIPYHFGNGAKKSDEPLQTVTTVGNHAVITPFLIPQQSNPLPKAVNMSVPTIVANSPHIGLIQPIVIDQSHPGEFSDFSRCRMGEPIGTITTRNNWSVVQPFLSSYYQGGTNTKTSDPVPVITTHDRFGLIQGNILILPDGKQYQLDITHRMLTAAELAAATGFPDWYKFAGGDTAAKKQIGNAVCPDLAKALYLAALSA